MIKHSIDAGSVNHLDGKKYKVFIVQKRDTKTLEKLILDNFDHNSIVFSDGWAAYRKIKYEQNNITHIPEVHYTKEGKFKSTL